MMVLYKISLKIAFLVDFLERVHSIISEIRFDFAVIYLDRAGNCWKNRETVGKTMGKAGKLRKSREKAGKKQWQFNI